MILSIKALHGGYGSTSVLHGLDLDIGVGERRAIIGRNGAGKTTLLKAIMGIVPVREGVITFDGSDLTRMRTHGRARLGIGYVPQGRQIFPRLSVLENLRVGGVGSGSPDWKSTLDEVMDEFPMLAEKANALGGSLSGGQQQLLALGRALMLKPKLLLLDEPTEGIQPSIRDQIVGHVNSICQKSGMAVVVVEQNLDFASAIADTGSIIVRGRVVAELPTAEIVNDRALQHKFLGV
ncbi:MAG: ABC transporter ATP-binding protein [Nocardioidaceae bacterium]|nr:MAG: ABC transporter ATP-binding protein [Nocardioidaceae bacterium]